MSYNKYTQEPFKMVIRFPWGLCRLGFRSLGFRVQMGAGRACRVSRFRSWPSEFWKGSGRELLFLGQNNNPNPPKYLLYRALGALVPYIVGTWGVRVNKSTP